MPGSTGARPTKDQTLQRRARAVELRKQGNTYEQIAATEWEGRRLYANRDNARKAVLAALGDTLAEEVAELRQIQHLRYEALIYALWRRVTSGRKLDADTMRELRLLMADQNKLWGLNAPTRLEVSDDMDREIEAMVASFNVADQSWDVTGVPLPGQDETLISPPEVEG